MPSRPSPTRQAVILWAITGVIGMVFIAIVTLVIVRVRRRKNRNNGPGPGGPGVPDEYSYLPDTRPPATACPRISNSPCHPSLRLRISSRHTTDTPLSNPGIRDSTIPVLLSGIFVGCTS